MKISTSDLTFHEDSRINHFPEGLIFYGCQAFILLYMYLVRHHKIIEPRCEKTGLLGFRPGLTQDQARSLKFWI